MIGIGNMPLECKKLQGTMFSAAKLHGKQGKQVANRLYFWWFGLVWWVFSRKFRRWPFRVKGSYLNQKYSSTRQTNIFEPMAHMCSTRLLKCGLRGKSGEGQRGRFMMSCGWRNKKIAKKANWMPTMPVLRWSSHSRLLERDLGRPHMHATDRIATWTSWERHHSCGDLPAKQGAEQRWTKCSCRWWLPHIATSNTMRCQKIWICGATQRPWHVARMLPAMLPDFTPQMLRGKAAEEIWIDRNRYSFGGHFRTSIGPELPLWNSQSRHVAATGPIWHSSPIFPFC